MHYKRIIFIFSIIIIFSIITIICLQSNDKVIFKSGNINDNRVVNSNVLTMMYETEASSGEYAVSSDISWPQKGYVFNEQLSSCENGSSIAWDDNTKRVIVEANSADKCYVYFDKVNYILGNQNTMEVYVDETDRLIASAVRTNVNGGNITETFHFIANTDITNINISVRYNPSVVLYRGRIAISYVLPPQMIDTGVDKYVDGEPIFLTGSLNAGDELIIVLQRYNYNASGIDSNIDFIMTGDGL